MMVRTEDGFVMIIVEPRNEPTIGTSFGFYWWDEDEGQYVWWMSMWGEDDDNADSLLTQLEDVLRKGMQEAREERKRAADAFAAGVYV